MFVYTFLFGIHAYMDIYYRGIIYIRRTAHRRRHIVYSKGYPRKEYPIKKDTRVVNYITLHLHIEPHQLTHCIALML